MSALIPALISLLMSRARGGGGGGGGGGEQEQLSDAEKDRRYWDRALLNPPWADQIGKGSAQRTKTMQSPVPTWERPEPQ